MKPILSPAQAAGLDAAAAGRGIEPAVLMERAGDAVARAALAVAGGRYGRRVSVVCGPGNNGGDGAVAARLLRSWGCVVEVVAVGGPPTREPASAARRALEAAGVPVVPFARAALDRALTRSDAAIDALVGIGFHGPAAGDVASAIEALDAAACPVVAVDVPSGLDAATGAVDGPAVRAEATVTMGALKPGLVLAPARAGHVEIAPIFPPDLVASDLGLVEAADVAALLPRRDVAAHKRSSGVVVAIGGSRRMPGAIAMAARAAARAGAGLVQVAVPSGILSVVERLVPEATFLPLTETPSGGIADADDAFAAALARADAVVVGPGAGNDAPTARWIRSLVDGLVLPAVLDADGLNAFAGATLRARPAGLVLTPHAGEFLRLAEPGDPSPGGDRIAAARALARRTGATVVLKGPATVIADPDGRARVNPTGDATLATAGTGDVLAGAIGAFLARGLAPGDAAVAATYVHGVAGERAGADLGEGATAGDVLDRLAGAIGSVRA